MTAAHRLRSLLLRRQPPHTLSRRPRAYPRSPARCRRPEAGAPSGCFAGAVRSKPPSVAEMTSTHTSSSAATTSAPVCRKRRRRQRRKPEEGRERPWSPREAFTLPFTYEPLVCSVENKLLPLCNAKKVKCIWPV